MLAASNRYPPLFPSPRQALHELRFAGMPDPDRGRAFFKRRHRVPIRRDSPQFNQKPGGAVVRRWVGSIDLRFDIAPDAFTSPGDGQQPRLADFSGIIRLLFFLGGATRGRDLLANIADCQGARPELADRSGDCGRGAGRQLTV